MGVLCKAQEAEGDRVGHIAWPSVDVEAKVALLDDDGVLLHDVEMWAQDTEVGGSKRESEAHVGVPTR